MKDVYLERLLDAYSPVVSSDYYSPASVRVAASIKSSSGILKAAYDCTAAAYFGRVVFDPRVVHAAHKMYGNVIRDLQKALSSTTQSRSMETLLTVTMLLIYEVI